MNPRVNADVWRMPHIELINGQFRMSVTQPASVTDLAYGAE